MKKLFKKLFRDIKKSLGQFIAVCIVSAIGVALLTGLAVAHSTLQNTADTAYTQSNLADLTAYYLGIDGAGVDQIKKVNGVADAYGRLELKAESTDNESAFLVHTVSDDEKINIPALGSGHMPQTNDECMIDSAYASANHLSTGDKISVVVNQKNYSFTVSGIFHTAEYIYLIEDPTKSVIPDHKTYGLLYVNESLTNSLMGSDAYNEVLVTVKKDANASLVGKEIENTTKSYGFGQIVLKKDQPSYTQLQSDIDGVGAISKSFPYIFFLVAAVIIFISMSRTIQLERNQIGIMKALGIRSASIMAHYLSYAVLCGLSGSLLGNLLGSLIMPNIIFNSYKMIYTFPKIQYSYSGYVWYIVMSTVVVMLSGMIASFLSARKVMKEVPAQCMRPMPPKKVHKTWIEKRKRLWDRISYRNKLIIRNILLNKRRAILSSIGVIGCVGILIGAFGLKEAVTNMFDMQFNKMQVFDDMLTLSAPVPYSTPAPFHNSNIRQADKLSVIPAIISLSKDVSANLYALSQDNSSFQLYNSSGDKLRLPDDGIVVPYKLAQEYDLKVGDTVTVRLESDLYQNKSIQAKVSAVDVLYLSQDLYASYAYLQKEGVTPYVNGYYINVKNKSLLTDTNQYLSGVSNVKSVVKNSTIKDETVSLMGMLNIEISIMILMAGALALAVIFNISSINIFERRRDIATLKVLGYQQKEVNSLVHVENLIITAFGCIFGIAFGAVVLQSLLGEIGEGDMYIPGKLSFGVVAVSVALAFVFTLFVNFMLRGKMHRIDMVESLKSVE